MTAFVVQDSTLRRQDMEGAVTGTTNIGAGPGPGTFAEGFYQGAQAWGRRPNSTNAQRGFFVTITSTDMTVAGDNVVAHKGFLVNVGQIHSSGMRARIGSGTGDYYEYVLRDDGSQGDDGEFQIEANQRFLFNHIDPSVVAWRDSVAGTPVLTAVTEIAITNAVTVNTVGASNIFDAIDIGPGQFGTRGDGGSFAPGTFAAFVLDDEGTVTAGRFGHASSNPNGAVYYGAIVLGEDNAGSATIFEFVAANFNVTWPGGLVDAGYNKLHVNMATISDVCTLTNGTLKGGGRDNRQVFFDSELEVTGGATDTIDITAHPFKTGDLLTYDAEGGTVVGGLTTATDYFWETVDANSGSLHAVGATVGRQNAFTGAAPISLTPASVGTGESHSLRRTPDTRPILTSTGTTESPLLTSVTFDRWGSLDPTSSWTFDKCNFLASSAFTLGGATLTDCTVQDALLGEGESFLSSADFDDIGPCLFIRDSSEGHALRRTGTTGTDAWSSLLDGYWTHGGVPGDGARFDTTSGVDAGTDVITTNDTHGLVDGEHIFYDPHGGTAEPMGAGVTASKFYAHVLTTTTFSVHQTRAAAIANSSRVALTSAGGETHAIYSGRAAVVNGTGDAWTINNSGGDTPYVRNIGAATTTVNATVSVTVTPVFIGSEVRAFLTGTSTEVGGGVENSAGTSVVLSLESGIAVDIWVLSTPTASRPDDIAAVPVQLQNVSFTVSQSLDPQQRLSPNFDNPD